MLALKFIQSDKEIMNDINLKPKELERLQDNEVIKNY